ncbi:ankyrin repeat-containing domain protein [Geopyxis carbonaria]|nr:ankyrin repeat-containing domain protein [Geopyxis carbonaria]
MPALRDLPPELLLLTIAHLPAFRDLAALARTCKRLSATLQPTLFHRAATASTYAHRDTAALALHSAAATGHVRGLRILTSLGVSPSLPSPAWSSNITPLHTAALHNNTACIALLLSLGASPSAATTSGAIPLHYAARAGALEAALALLPLGGVHTPDLAGSTPLLAAAHHQKTLHVHAHAVAFCSAVCAHPAICAALLEAGAAVNATDLIGRTALHRAAGALGSADTVRVLLAAGADLGVCDRLGQTALWRACECEGWEVGEMLVEAGAEVGPGVLAHARVLGNLEAVNSMEAARGRRGVWEKTVERVQEMVRCSCGERGGEAVVS